MTKIKTILASETKYEHLIWRLLYIWLLTFLLFVFVMPVIYWLTFGDSATNNYRTDLIMVWFPLFFGVLITSVGIQKNIRRSNLSNAKSYLIVGLSLVVIYPLIILLLHLCH